MTVRHRQRKGAKSGFFLYAREKAFSKPQLFPPKPPEDSLHMAKYPYTPRQLSPPVFAPAQPRCPPFSRQKGAFLPPAPAVPAFLPARTSGFAPGAARFLPGARPDGDPACPGFARDPGARAHPWDPGSPRVCGFFARPHPLLPAVRRPNARRLPRPPPKPPRRAPPARPLPPPAARRSARRPAEAQPWGWQSRLPRSAFPLRREEVCDPRGRSDPWA